MEMMTPERSGAFSSTAAASAAIALFATLALAGCSGAPAGTASSSRPDPYEAAQKYWDGQTAAKPTGQVAVEPSGAACEARLRAYLALERRYPDQRHPSVREYERPELMALGDSLYNGVQSMRINWWLAEWSAPALVAIRLGLIQELAADRTGDRLFYVPQYPTQGSSPSTTQNFGFNLEDIPPGLSVLGAPLRQVEPLRRLAFDYAPPNGRAMVENIAFSGANSHDLLFWTAADHAARARFYLDRLSEGGIASRFGSLGAAFFHANAAFVLNPTRDPCVARLTPLDHVVLRKPRRLLVNIGPNDGLWLLAFKGAPVTALACSPGEAAILGPYSERPRCAAVSIKNSMETVYVENIRALLDRLSAVDGLEVVYLNGLPLPSQTANLVPERHGAGLSWYSDMISGNVQRARSTDEQVRAADDLIRRVNARVSALVAEKNGRPGSSRFVWVDMAARLGDFDAKRCAVVYRTSQQVNQCTSSRQLRVDRRRFGGGTDASFDNRPIRLEGETGTRTGLGFEPKVTQGGLFSFDNMHLSSIGYEILAETVTRAMRANGETRMLRAYNPDGSDPCKAPGNPGYRDMQPGDCAALLTTPGWSYSDATRRQFVFLRRAGLEETQDRTRLSARIAFLQQLFQ